MAKDRPRYMTAEVREDVEYDDEHISAAKQLQIDTVSTQCADQKPGGRLAKPIICIAGLLGF